MNQPHTCERCGRESIEAALMEYNDELYCQSCWQYRVYEQRGGVGWAGGLLMIILALLVILPFFIILL